MGENSEVASSFADSRSGLHHMSPGWCTLPHLSSHPWELISVHHVHNSTVSKPLRYSLKRGSVPQPVTWSEAPHAVPKYSPGDYFFEKI